MLSLSQEIGKGADLHVETQAIRACRSDSACRWIHGMALART
jgi:hypothetical protein